MSGHYWRNQVRSFLLLYLCSFPLLSLPHPSPITLASEWEMGEGKVPGGGGHTHSFLSTTAGSPAGRERHLTFGWNWAFWLLPEPDCWTANCSCDLNGPMHDACLTCHAGMEGRKEPWSQTEKRGGNRVPLWLHPAECRWFTNWLLVCISISLTGVLLFVIIQHSAWCM